MTAPSSTGPAPAGPTRGGTAPASATPATGNTAGTDLESSHGRTTIADAVVSKVAGLAAREVPGVYGFGGSGARAFGAITERIPGGRASTTQGVSVEVGERQAAVDLTIVVEYGAAIAELAQAVRRNVIGAIEQMTGLEVVEVNVHVVDLHLPDPDAGAPAPTPSPQRVR